MSWILENGYLVNGYNISYSSTASQCVIDSGNVTGIGVSETSYTLFGLEEGTEYIITVTALLVGRGSDEESVTAITLAAGEYIPKMGRNMSNQLSVKLFKNCSCIFNLPYIRIFFIFIDTYVNEILTQPK